MTRVGLLSDTHNFLPEAVFQHFNDVDLILHAGDIGTEAVSKRLETFKPLKAVYGNIDGKDIRVVYPEYLVFDIEKVKVLMIHIGGYPQKYNTQSKKLIEKYKPHLFICGHSHILKVMPDPELNLLHINPGACGKHGWHKVSTLIKFDVDSDRIRNLQVIELNKS